MTDSLKIIHIEDVPSDAELVDRTLKKSGIVFEKVIVDTRDEYIKALKEFEADIILSDHSLPSFNSLEALKILKNSEKDIPFILITSTVSEEFAVSVMKEGASDYVLKDRLQRLPNAIINAIEKYQSDNDRQTYLSKIVASEALFTKAELIAEFGTWRFNIRANTINWSAGNDVLLGYEHGEVAPSFENFLKNIFPDDLQRMENIFKNIVNEHPGEIDFRVINKDGSHRYIHSQFELETNEKGEPAYIIGFNQDITRSKLAQDEIQRNMEELQAAGARQSAILNALPPNIVLLNEAGKIIAVNGSWKKLTLENNLGVPKYGIDYSYIAIAEKAIKVDEVSWKKIGKGVKEVIAGLIDEFSLEYSCYSKHKKLWFQVIIVPLTDKTKKGAVVLHTDITDRKITEELLFQSKANLQTIFENTDVAYVLCNTESKIVSFNVKAAELCLECFDKKPRVGSDVFSYFRKSRIPGQKEAFQKVLRNETVTYETNYPVEGGVKWYEVRWAGVADEQKMNIGFIFAFKDITERKIDDLDRDRMTADLAQRYKDLEQFTYIVSHNLRAPVANIIGLSNMLNSLDFNIAECSEVLGALATSTTVLDKTIMDLNHVLQVRSDINEQQEAVSFERLVEDITLSLNNMVIKENASIKADFSAADNIITIKSYMYSIFYNLILNAIKYKRPDADPVISIVSRREEDGLELTFTDNGKGIDEANFKNLFGLYKRFDNTVEGKGLGLFMVKMQVESLEGTISVQSKPGHGTTFRLEFPKVKFV